VSASPDSVAGGTAPARPSAAGAPQRTADQIRRDVVARRGELAGSVEVLRRRVTELTDWRRQVREHRDELIAGAALAGFVVGGFLALRRRRRRS
jgi:C4-dicarboxylate-specific signal transduction histidine kinase